MKQGQSKNIILMLTDVFIIFLDLIYLCTAKYGKKNYKEFRWMYPFIGAIYIKMQERLIQMRSY